MTPLTLGADQIHALISGFLWPLFRVAGLMSLLPVLGGGEVPVRVRLGLSAAITLLLLPILEPVPILEPLSLQSLIITFQQILIGIAMGLVVLLVFNAVTMAGESIAITMGLGFALMNDPRNGVQVPTVSQFYLILATLLFLAFDGHHAVLLLLAESFSVLPVGTALGADAIWQLVNWAAVVFRGALSIALPALAAMLSVNIIMGVMTRAAPQLNLFSIGFPITMTVGFISILLTLPLFDKSFHFLFMESLSSLRDVLGR